MLLWPGAPVLIGTDEVVRFTRTIQKSAPARLTWQPLEIHLSRDSTLGVLWGIALAS